jgi:ribosomal protein S18 acetylase RimI-like enzyme
VLWSNQGAVRLYKRLGFEVSGGDQLYCQMKRRPPAEPTPPWAISLRPVTAGDESLLLELYASTRADELVMAPWTSKQKEEFIRMQFEAQRQHYEKEFPNAKHQLVCLNGAPCGRVYVARTDQDLHILDITIAPEKRNAGIGSMVLQALIFENVKTGGQVTIWVEDFNPSLRLFRRLGFQPSERQGFRLLLKRA